MESGGVVRVGYPGAGDYGWRALLNWEDDALESLDYVARWKKSA
jgi:hypothetical protein